MTIIAYLTIIDGWINAEQEEKIMREWCNMGNCVCYPCKDADDLKDLIKNHPRHRLVVLDPNGHKDFSEYTPTEKDIILIGRDNGGFCGVHVDFKNAYRVNTYFKSKEFHALSIAALILGKLVLD